MKEYRPSDSFVERVMSDVRRTHAAQQRKQQHVEKLLDQLPVRLLLASGAALFGIGNIVRVYFALFAPFLCK